MFREYPPFFAYTVFQIVEGGTLFVLDHIDAVSGDQYWLTHRVCQMFDTALRFAIIFEIFSSVFGKDPGLKQLTRVLFRGAAVVLLFAAIAVAARAPDDGTPAILSRVHLLNLSVDVMQSGLLLLLVGFASYFGLSWRSPAYGIC